MSLYVYFKLNELVTRSSVVSFVSYQQVRETKLILFADSRDLKIPSDTLDAAEEDVNRK